MLDCRITSQEPPLRTVGRRFDARRVYTVLVLAPLLYGGIRYLPPLGFIGLVFAFGAVALLEFFRLGLSPPHEQPHVGIGLLGFVAVILAPYQSAVLVPGLLAALIGTLSIPLVLRLPLDHVLKNAAVTLFGVLYLGVTMSFLVSTRLLSHGEWLVLFLLIVTWVGDTGAYYAGTIWGRHQLAPRISPKKSVEGLAGGVIAAIVAAYLARWWFLPMLSAIDCAILAVLLTGAGLSGRPGGIRHETQRRRQGFRRRVARTRRDARSTRQSLVHRPDLLLLCQSGHPPGGLRLKEPS